MQAISPTAPIDAATSTSLREKLLNIFTDPGEVFDEVVAAPMTPMNWRVPTLLVCLAGIVLQFSISGDQAATSSRRLIEAGAISSADAVIVSGGWPLVSSLAVCLAACAGTFWSAFVLWFIGRVFLKARFSFLKTLEVVGLTGMILVLGSIVTGLLVAVSGDVTARPALSLLAGKLGSASRLGALLDLMNVFHLWTTTVLAVGLSRLSGVSFRESAFWVFGYWMLARIALILLV